MFSVAFLSLYNSLFDSCITLPDSASKSSTLCHLPDFYVEVAGFLPGGERDKSCSVNAEVPMW